MNKIVAFIYFFSFAFAAKSQTDFTYSTSSGLFCSPSTILFNASFTGSPKGFVWTFGNGTGSNSQNPSATYNKAGTYTVKLIVIYARSASSVTKTIVINPSVTATIGFDRNYICQPGNINFTAGGSGGISNYNWDFGDGTVINTNTTNTTHNFAALGTYNVTLSATSSSGCFDTVQTVIKVQPFSITGTVLPTTGCVPANVSFNSTATIPKNSVISNYLWDFGDGSPIVSTITKTTNHVYATPGNYSPKVTITTSEGCTNSFNLNGTAYGTPPTNSIAYPVDTTICGSETAKFVSKATKANSYHWNFGDGQSATASDTITSHKYKTLGTKNVTVTPAYNGCNGTPVNFQINVVGVIATYNYSNTCTDKKTFSFTNTSQGNLSTVSWDFGDGSPVVNTLNAVHTFPQSGSFVTTLTVTDSITGCSDSYSITIYTSNPALINPDTSICKNSITTFSVINNYLNPSDTYTWHVAGQVAGPLTDSSITITAATLGNFNDYVIINNGSGYCKDTIRLNNTLLVRGPDLSFTAPNSICLNDMYNVTNTSKPFIPADSITMWFWNFGLNNANDSSYQPQPYLYKNAGTYKVKLTGIDINGCKDTLVKPVTVHPLPFLYLVPAIDTLCAGTVDTLFAFHDGKIQWSPAGSLSCNSCDTALTTASSDTKYYITDTTSFGCKVIDSIMVKVYPPFTAVALNNNPYICLNDTVQLNVEPPGKVIVWTPPAGLSNPNNYGPIASPLQNTTYTAMLTDSAGCFTSSVNINVFVKSLPQVDAGPDQIVPYNSLFSINPVYSNNVQSYNWSPGTLLNCTTCADPTGTALSSNTYFIKVSSDSGCVALDSIHIFVQCKDSYILMPNAFTPNGDNLNDYFYPLTRGIKIILRFSIYDRFGKLVYEARNFVPNDKTYGWNGKVGGVDATTNVFVYYLEALCDVGEKLSKKGSVVLIK